MGLDFTTAVSGIPTTLKGTAGDLHDADTRLAELTC